MYTNNKTLKRASDYLILCAKDRTLKLTCWPLYLDPLSAVLCTYNYFSSPQLHNYDFIKVSRDIKKIITTTLLYTIDLSLSPSHIQFPKIIHK